MKNKPEDTEHYIHFLILDVDELDDDTTYLSVEGDLSNYSVGHFLIRNNNKYEIMSLTNKTPDETDKQKSNYLLVIKFIHS